MFNRAQEKERNAEYRDLLIAYKKVFSGEEGKKVLYDLINHCNILTSHNGDAYKEGRRSVVCEILHKTNISIAQFDAMLKGDDK